MSLILWQYPAAFGLPSLSPFCVKVEAYLRLRGLAYTAKVTSNPRRGPHGKMPVLEDGGQVIADSRLIVSHLEATHPVGLDAWLSDDQRATGLAVQRLVEEHLYFALMRLRWVEPAGWRACRRAFATAFPWGTGWLALGLLRWLLRGQCRAQGFGRLPAKDAYGLAVADLAAIEQLLSDAFLFGHAPTSFDASIYAFLRTIARFPAAGQLGERIHSSPKLQSYLQRMEDLCGFGTGGR